MENLKVDRFRHVIVGIRVKANAKLVAVVHVKEIAANNVQMIVTATAQMIVKMDAIGDVREDVKPHASKPVKERVR